MPRTFILYLSAISRSKIEVSRVINNIFMIENYSSSTPTQTHRERERERERLI